MEQLISMDWRNRAACLDKDPELFFPVGNTGPALLQIEEAKSVCRRCRPPCACRGGRRVLNRNAAAAFNGRGRFPICLDQANAVFVRSGGATCACGTALECAALVFAHPAPNTGVLSRFEGPLKAGVHHRTTAAHTFGFLDLQESWPGVSYWEEQLRVLVEARCAVTPIHADQSLHSWELVEGHL